jgi:hypothetical protein
VRRIGASEHRIDRWVSNVQHGRFERSPVWGMENLYVADGSVCPTQGSANPALTIMALASRLAQRMAGVGMTERAVAGARG